MPEDRYAIRPYKRRYGVASRATADSGDAKGGYAAVENSTSRVGRWQVVPATLSVFVGVCAFVISLLFFWNVMLPEAVRSLTAGDYFMPMHSVSCMVCSLCFVIAAMFVVFARGHWMESRYRDALLYSLAYPVAISLFGVLMLFFVH